jgi:hypothetical protein
MKGSLSGAGRKPMGLIGPLSERARGYGPRIRDANADYP